MRKIEKEIMQAWNEGRNWHKDNTAVEFRATEMYGFTKVLRLHGNAIAQWNTIEGLKVCHCGWETATTKSRLNCLPGVRVSQNDFQWYLNGQPFTRGWHEVR
jgi:hypothetical protein